MLHETIFPPRLRCVPVAVVMLILSISANATGQNQVTVFASGLMDPIGIQVDDAGNVWVAEQGTGADDGRISVVTPDGTRHSFIEGLDSRIVMGNPESAQHLRLMNNSMYIAYGLGAPNPESFLAHISTTGFTPGDAPFGPADLDLFDIGSFVLGEGIPESNAYNLTFGPDGNIYIADASANAIIRRNQGTGDLDVFATLPLIPNPTPVGPPVIEAVPTGIVLDDDRFLVTTFPGFPFVPGTARVYEVDLAGNVSVFKDDLTSAVDIALDPRDGKPVVLQFGEFDLAVGFVPGTGSVMKLHGSDVSVLASGLDFTAGLAFSEAGELYVSSLAGEILKIDVNTFEANLAGYNEVLTSPFGPQEEGFFPVPAITPASGWFEATLDGDQLHMTGEFSGLVGNYTASHIHIGVAGVAGPVVVPLNPTVDGDMRGGTFDETAALSDDLIAALLAGELYVNVHSQVYPPGEVRGQLLLKPNSPPEQADAQMAEGFDLDWVNEGAPGELAFVLEWDPATDPNGDRVIYQSEFALDADFNMIIASSITVLEGDVFHFEGASKGIIDFVFEQLGIALGETVTVYGRINSSDGSLRTLGETLVANITRGIVQEPVDEDPPLCRIVQVNPGPPAFVEVEVQDQESGLASIEILRDVNLTVEVPEFETGTTEPLIVRGTKIDNAARATLVIRVTDVAGNETVCDPVIATLVAEVPSHFELGQNYPNPFNPSTSFELLLPESGHVTLNVYDVSGRLVTTLINQHMEAGTYRIEWDGTGDSGILPSGVYFYQVSAVEYQAVRKMTLIR